MAKLGKHHNRESGPQVLRQLKAIAICLLLWVAKITYVRAQDPWTYIRTHAIPIDSPELPNDAVYNLLEPYPLVMVGEMPYDWQDDE